jgi:hypothetical protein
MAAARPLRLALTLLAALLLAACATVPGGGPVPGGGVARGVPVPVALLVPGSAGQAGDAVVSRDLERAARLAAADLGGAVELRVYETGGTAAGASAAAGRAVREGAAVIAGPLYAGAANAAGLAAAPSGVNVLAFSNNTAIAGGNVFVLGATFDNTAERLLRFAARQGRDDVVVVAASNASGEAAQAALRRAAQATGTRILAVQRYEFSEQGVAAAAPAVARTVQATGADTVVLTSDTAGALPLLAQLLPEAGVAAPAQQYVGLTRWDIPPATLSLAGLQGGWFALPDQSRAAAFRARFSEAYGGAPHPLAGLAYDAVAAVGALASEGRAPGARELTRSRGFEGTGGAFRLRPDGTVERALAVAQVQGGRAAVLDAAPQRFGGGLGFGL